MSSWLDHHFLPRRCTFHRIASSTDRVHRLQSGAKEVGFPIGRQVARSGRFPEGQWRLVSFDIRDVVGRRAMCW